MKIKVAILLIFYLLHAGISAMAQETVNDSIPEIRRPGKWMSPALGGGLVIAGSLLNFDHGGRQIGGVYPSAFNYKFDGALPYLPVVAWFGMRQCGIEGRTTNFWELVARGATGLSAMLLSTESTKRLTGRVRPDGSDDHSFPSRHSATAFLSATFFAKEFGSISPWYSVGAYTVATSTTMLRRVNDKHWMSDVMVGAGIGILSAELAYAIMDVVFKTKNQGTRSGGYRLQELPSSVGGVYMKYVLPDAISGVCERHQVRSRLGYAAGMELRHFFNSYLGVSGRMGIVSSQIEVDGHVVESSLDQVNFAAGPRVQIPIYGGLHAGAYVHGGYGFYPNAPVLLEGGSKPLLLGGCSGWGGEGGLSLGYITREGVSLNLVAEYQSWSSPSPGFDNQGVSLGLSAGWAW